MVYHLKESDIDKGARVLGRSFIDSPGQNFIFPDYQYRITNNYHIFAFLIRFAMRNGWVVAPSKNIEGVAIWSSTFVKSSPLRDSLKAGYISLFKAIDFKSFIRFSKLGIVSLKERPSVMNETNCFLLETIGVDPSYQNQGFAKMLIESQLNIADKKNMSCYLEAHCPEIIDFYNKFDFVQIHEYTKIDIRTYCLYRKSKNNA